MASTEFMEQYWVAADPGYQILYRRTTTNDGGTVYHRITKRLEASGEMVQVNDVCAEEYAAHRAEPVQRKTRHYLLPPYAALVVDQFGDNPLHCLAELEIKEGQHPMFALAEWIESEVTHDPLYKSHSIAHVGFPQQRRDDRFLA